MVSPKTSVDNGPPARDAIHQKARGGRRAGESGTRDLILGAARRRFADLGYRGTTIRAIASDAGVDPALVHHFYGTKDRLFDAVVALPVDVEAVAAMISTAPSHAGEDFVRYYFGLWEDPVTGPALLATFRHTVSQDQTSNLLREFVSVRLLRPLAAQLQQSDQASTSDAERRIALAASQVVGAALVRYVVAVPALRDADLERVIADIAPTVQHYLTGPLSS